MNAQCNRLIFENDSHTACLTLLYKAEQKVNISIGPQVNTTQPPPPSLTLMSYTWVMSVSTILKMAAMKVQQKNMKIIPFIFSLVL